VSRAGLAGLAIALAALTGAGLGLVATLAAGGGSRKPTLPRMHGQVTWSSGERRAPPFTLRDHNGRSVSLGRQTARKHPVLVTFLDSRCRQQCPIEGRTLAQMLEQMPAATRPTLLIVSVDPAGDTPASIRHAMARWRLDGPWTWHWLRGTRSELAPVWRKYGITVEPTSNDITHGMALYLIDRQGFERSGYLFPFLPNFVTLDLRALARQAA
jgi:cytochrome oxidase Cu insertion factor (SCO1/SenC/PrrC family)